MNSVSTKFIILNLYIVATSFITLQSPPSTPSTGKIDTQNSPDKSKPSIQKQFMNQFRLPKPFAVMEKLLSQIPEGFELAGQPIVNIIGQDIKIAYIVKKENKYYVVEGNNLSEDFDYVENLQFSPDGRQLIFSAKKNGKLYAVISNKKSEEFDDIGKFSFIPNRWGIHTEPASQFIVVYTVKKENKWYVIVGPFKSEGYDEVGLAENQNIQSQPNQPPKTWFWARKGKEIWFQRLEKIIPKK